MKYFWSILLTLVILVLSVLGILAIWGIYPIPDTIIWKTLITIAIAFVAYSILWLCVTVFFKKEKHRNDGNKAHRMD